MKAVYDQFFITLCLDGSLRKTLIILLASSPSSNTPFENPNGQQQGEMRITGMSGTAQAFHSLPQPISSLHERVRASRHYRRWQPSVPMRGIRMEHGLPTSWSVTRRTIAATRSWWADVGHIPLNPRILIRWCIWSMVLQAEGIRYGVGALAALSPARSWHAFIALNDCWPVASWSSLDYFGRWKACIMQHFVFTHPCYYRSRTNQPNRMFISPMIPANLEGSVHWSLKRWMARWLEAKEETAKAAPFDATTVCRLIFLNFSMMTWLARLFLSRNSGKLENSKPSNSFFHSHQTS